MKKIFYIVPLAVCLSFAACERYLDKQLYDTFENKDFWTKESNIRLYAQRAYTSYFTGYGSGFTWGDFFTGGAWSDEYSTSALWTENTATSGNGWSFTWVRWANVMLENIEKMETLTVEQKKHWSGIGHFFRAMEYADLSSTFGDVPYFDKVIDFSDKEQSYKKRDPMAFVTTKIMEDFQYAVDNIRENDGQLQVNRDIALSYMSRRLLYLGTFLKYHNIDQNVAKTLLEKSVWASEQLIKSGKYQIVDDYRGIFTSANLAGNKEVIFYRQYEPAKATHCLISYNNLEAQTGTTLKVVETYLASDGLPIKQSPVYNYAADNGKRYYPDQYKNRDPRMAASLVDSIRLNGVHNAYSTTGFLSWKFLPYEANEKDQSYLGSTNITDAPLIRYGEILLNYAEAMYELGKFDQSIADNTINLLRNRAIKKNNVGNVLPKLPKMIVSGENVTANGVVINDPSRDADISPLLWEIRRERSVELLYEGFRKRDLKRWKKYEYLKTEETNSLPTNMGIGAYVDLNKFTKADQEKIKKAYKKFYIADSSQPNKVFVYNLYDNNMRRSWVTGNSYYERQYLNAIPLDQIKLYKDLGYELTQNPGWDTNK